MRQGRKSCGLSLFPIQSTKPVAFECGAIRTLKLPNPRHSWRPHITLARLHHADPVKLARLLSLEAGFALEPVFVHRFALFSARPRMGGGSYVVEALYPLRGGLGTGDDEDGNPW